MKTLLGIILISIPFIAIIAIMMQEEGIEYSLGMLGMVALFFCLIGGGIYLL